MVLVTAASMETQVANEMVERAARAMYADVEVGEWERGNLDTLLAYRRAARIAIEAGLAYMVEKNLRVLP